MKIPKNNNNMLQYLSLLVALLTLFSTCVGMTPHSVDHTDAITATDSDDNLRRSHPVSSLVLNPSSNMGETYLRKIIFLGDSTTYHMISRGVLPEGTETKQVWGPSNGTLMLSSAVTSLKIVYPDNNTEMTIAEAAALKKPEFMLLTIGLNGSHNFTEAVYKGSYRKLIEAIQSASPNTKIILQSVFPVASNENTWTSVTAKELNLCIDQINLWAKELASEYENIRYLDTQSVLRDEENFLKQAYQSGDGIHLSVQGYETILDYICTHAWQN